MSCFHYGMAARYGSHDEAIAKALTGSYRPPLDAVSARVSSSSGSCESSATTIARGIGSSSRTEGMPTVDVEVESCKTTTYNTLRTRTEETRIPHVKWEEEWQEVVEYGSSGSEIYQDEVCSENFPVRKNCRTATLTRTTPGSMTRKLVKVPIKKEWYETKTTTRTTGSAGSYVTIVGKATFRLGSEVKQIPFEEEDARTDGAEHGAISTIASVVRRATSAHRIAETSARAEKAVAAGETSDAEGLYLTLIALDAPESDVAPAKDWFTKRYSLDLHDVTRALSGGPTAAEKTVVETGTFPTTPAGLPAVDDSEVRRVAQDLYGVKRGRAWGLGIMMRGGYDSSVAVRQSALDKDKQTVTLRNWLIIGDTQGFALRFGVDGELASVAGASSGFSTGGFMHFGGSNEGKGFVFSIGMLGGEQSIAGTLPKESHLRIPLHGDFSFFGYRQFFMSFDLGIDPNILALTDRHNARLEHASPLGGGVTFHVARLLFARGGVSLPFGIDTSPRLGVEAGLHL